MTEFIEIHWTSGSLDEARKISRYLVQEGLIACAQIIPWVESIYLWNQQLETTQESKIVLKTKKEHFEKIKEIIEKNTQYQVPEILVFSIIDGNKPYLDWLDNSTKSNISSGST